MPAEASKGIVGCWVAATLLLREYQGLVGRSADGLFAKHIGCSARFGCRVSAICSNGFGRLILSYVAARSRVGVCRLKALRSKAFSARNGVAWCVTDWTGCGACTAPCLKSRRYLDGADRPRPGGTVFSAGVAISYRSQPERFFVSSERLADVELAKSEKGAGRDGKAESVKHSESASVDQKHSAEKAS